MKNANPTIRDVLLTGVLPTFVALLVASVIAIERLQIDWAADFSSGRPWARVQPYVLWGTAIVVFFLGHALAATWTVRTHSARGVAARTAKLTVLAAVMLYKGYGAMFVLAFFLLPLLAVFGVSTGPDHPLAWLVLPLVIVPGVALGVGLPLALMAGPNWRYLSWPERRRVVTFYGASTAIGLLILAGSMSGFLNPQATGFAAAPFWQVLTVLATLGLSAGAIWMAALQAYWRSGHVLKSRACWTGLGVLFAAAVGLAATAHAFVRSGTTILGVPGGALAKYVRDGLPTIHEPVEIKGLRFVGPREFVATWRSNHGIVHIETPRWSVPQDKHPKIIVEPIERETFAKWPKPDCIQTSATQRLCTDLTEYNAKRAARPSRDRPAVFVFGHDSELPEAEIFFTPYGPTKDCSRSNSKEQSPPYGRCDLTLRGVPASGYLTRAHVACPENWASEARRLKAMMAEWFQPK